MTLSTPGSNQGFRKKRYTPRSFLAGIGQFTRNIPRLVRAVRADRVDAQFAEKIMLAVTAVNGCRYCTRYHTEVARNAGIQRETVDRILESDVETGVEASERPALVFAQQYAEADTDPSSEARMEFQEAYDRQTAEDIMAFVQAIYIANLMGNTLDALVFAIGRNTRETWALLESGCMGARSAVKRLRQSCPI